MVDVAATPPRAALPSAKHRKQESTSGRRSTRHTHADVRTLARVLSQVIQMHVRQMVTQYGTRRMRYPATHSGATSSGGYRTNSSCGRYCAWSCFRFALGTLKP